MNKIFLVTLFFTFFSFADVDLGDDFVAGDLISAEEFNEKFRKYVRSTFRCAHLWCRKFYG